MKLVAAQIQNFRSILDSSGVPVEGDVTVLVGKNESGKTAFLSALHRCRSGDDDAKFQHVRDYPRRKLTQYERTHEESPATVAHLQYSLESVDIARVEADLGFGVAPQLLEVEHHYGNKCRFSCTIDEPTFIKHLIESHPFSSDVLSGIQESTTLRDLSGRLQSAELTAPDAAFLKDFNARFLSPCPDDQDPLQYYVWQKHLEPFIPKFLYFDEYRLLPAKVNLKQLKYRRDHKTLHDSDRTVLGLLRLAGVPLSRLLETSGYETTQARLEGISNSVTDQIFEYWSQNDGLEVLFTISADIKDEAPYNDGPNLYIRIRSTRNRVSVPFDQRSKGFRWFFSFIVWFDSARELAGLDSEPVILLDEPGLSLHALAQADLLRYIRSLSGKCQVLYSTHSPFMVESSRLESVRCVVDQGKLGSLVTQDLGGTDSDTLFPLQAALGYSIAQNLFISDTNLLVEGPSDVIYMQYFSGNEQTELDLQDFTLVPVGGLDKVATFVALMAGNDLKCVVLHDTTGRPEQRLEDLVRRNLLDSRRLLNYAMFTGGKAADVEDLFSVDDYLQLFNFAYIKDLSEPVNAADLPPGNRIVDRINRYLAGKGLSLRRAGGFHHLRVAKALLSMPATVWSNTTVTQFRSAIAGVTSAV